MHSEAGGPTGVVWAAGRCRSCEGSHYPLRARCPHCWSEDVSDVPIESEGTLETFTIIRRAPEGVPVPYAVGWARFTVEGVRVFGPIHPGALDDLAIGRGVVMQSVDADDARWPYWLRPSSTPEEGNP